eukprot:TRINITY_DN2326_c0_g1_i2.p1 TRINITY_DN2326_c0_g1~~TRINITY_DN2326_c0_g1_i2.p1  ORF type:complete len:427 (-),score=123.79 TRINITY_DN2326_c0_g1_i2:56-1291(-)
MKGALLIIAVLALSAFAQNIPDSQSGYINVNKSYDSQMFWWLYGAQVSDRTSVPLVMWLQGGPGASSLYGDFLEMGPVDVYNNPRNTTWLQSANLLFVDNPIGAGYSYTNDNNGYATSDKQIGETLVNFLIQFFEKFPVFQKMPFWVFCESYGGKMTANFGVELDLAIRQKRIQANFIGVALGDSWIDPVGCMASYSPFLEAVSLIDENEAAQLTQLAQQAEAQWNAGQGQDATNTWSTQQDLLEGFAAEVNIYNYNEFSDYLPESQLDVLLNGPLKSQLGVPDNVTWGENSDTVFSYMSGDFMRPAYDKVDILLKAGYQVAVYSGQLDIIVDVICINNWIDKLTWAGLPGFLNSTRNPVQINQVPQGFSKSFQNFQLWNVLGAGHMVPADNPEMALQMFQSIITSVNMKH